MSPPRTSSPEDDRRAGQTRAGPYVAALLARERPVLLEWADASGSGNRRSGRLVAGTRAGGTLHVEPDGSDQGALPAPGAPVTLLVPTPSALWRLATTASPESAEGSVALAWPSEAAQETGRRFARARHMLAVRLSVGGRQGGPRGAGVICTYTLDVSIGGAQLAVPRQLSVGTPLQLEIRLPTEVVTAEAAVAWTRVIQAEPGDPMYGVGVRFASMPPRDGARLRAYIAAIGIP